MTSKQIQDRGWTPFWNWLFRYISASYCPINAKFGGWKQNRTCTNIT